MLALPPCCPALLGMGANLHWDCSKGRRGKLGAKLGSVFARTGEMLPVFFPCKQHHGIAQPRWHALPVLLSQRRGLSLTPSTTRSGPQSSCFRLFAN